MTFRYTIISNISPNTVEYNMSIPKQVIISATQSMGDGMSSISFFSDDEDEVSTNRGSRWDAESRDSQPSTPKNSLRSRGCRSSAVVSNDIPKLPCRRGTITYSESKMLPKLPTRRRTIYSIPSTPEVLPEEDEGEEGRRTSHKQSGQRV